MFDQFYDIIDYIFPVFIIRRDEVLSIEDRRPTTEMLLCGIGTLVLLGLTITFVSSGIRNNDFLGLAIPFAIGTILLGYRALTRTFREIYVFDKTQDTYWFTRQSVLKKEVIQGSSSQFRAAEVIKQTVYSDSGTSYIYKSALLQQPGLLLGTDETQILREDAPIYNNYRTEERIADAISSFLNITNNHEVDG